MMDGDLPLQASFHTDLVLGGYGRKNGQPIYGGCEGHCMEGNCNMVEEVDNSCGYFYDNPQWVDVKSSGEETRTYYWRDSNVSAQYGMNSNSSRGYVTVKDVWNAKADDQNNIEVTHDMYVVRYGRDDVRGKVAGNPGRGLACYNATNGTYTMKKDLGARVIDRGYEVVDNIHIGTFTYVLPPQTSSRGKYPNTGTLVRSWTQGYGNSDPYDKSKEMYSDMMFMGADFKNNLPNQFLPPVYSHTDQYPDICEDFVTVTVHFMPSTMSGADLEFKWWYNGETEADARTEWIYDVKAGMSLDVEISPVFPSRNHDVFIHWKARFVSKTPALKDSDWTSGSDEIIFIPPPNMSVPDITAAECTALVRGERLAEFEELTYYGKERKE